MKKFTKLALVATIVGGAYYLIKSKQNKPAVETAVDDDELFEGDFAPEETCDKVCEESGEENVKKFDVYKKKASEFAGKASEKATAFAKIVAEKAGEAKDYVGKKVESLKKKDEAEEAAESVEVAIEDAADTVADAVEEVKDAVEETVADFTPSEDPVDPEA